MLKNLTSLWIFRNDLPCVCMCTQKPFLIPFLYPYTGSGILVQGYLRASSMENNTPLNPHCHEYHGKPRHKTIAMLTEKAILIPSFYPLEFSVLHPFPVSWNED